MQGVPEEEVNLRRAQVAETWFSAIRFRIKTWRVRRIIGQLWRGPEAAWLASPVPVTQFPSAAPGRAAAPERVRPSGGSDRGGRSARGRGARTKVAAQRPPWRPGCPSTFLVEQRVARAASCGTREATVSVLTQPRLPGETATTLSLCAAAVPGLVLRPSSSLAQVQAVLIHVLPTQTAQGCPGVQDPWWGRRCPDAAHLEFKRSQQRILQFQVNIWKIWNLAFLLQNIIHPDRQRELGRKESKGASEWNIKSST
ncbi:uncharacterized protein LOC135576004 [Columba livia]|uniref:uncharacterized protein LOC135576004 n=1 Tax=Columba livia TaxID=8932 RepID=UPI0031BA80BB